MKIPVTPPKFKTLKYQKNLSELYSYIKATPQPTTFNNEYIHWDKLRHLQSPKGLTTEEWWLAIKLARQAIYKSLPLTNKHGSSFQLATPDIVLQKLHLIDRDISSSIHTNTSIINSHTRDNYLIRSLIEEATTSSQLEGASTTSEVAKEMLRKGRKPRNHSEKMIFNNYHAMQFIREIKNEALTPNIILELHHILTEGTLENALHAGHLRKEKNNIHVYDNRDGVILHTPPKAQELKQRLRTLCQFANANEENFFIHPVIKAILLHFTLAYDHPFVDGNGRTARALFYWSMAHQGYWSMEYISISSIIKQAPSQYARAFLDTETDDDDTTYFIIHQLNIILKAIETLKNYLSHKTTEIQQTEQLLQANAYLKNKLNYRQLALLDHALKHPNATYQIETHRASHNVTYDTARNDLLKLAKLKLMDKTKVGKAFVFMAPSNLKERIKNIKVS